MQPRSGRWWTKRLQWRGKVDPRLRRLDAALVRLPELWGAAVHVEFRPALTSRNRRLESGTGRGTEVHAASFLRRRRIVLSVELLDRPRELARILIHELFHFVWVRAGNSARRGFERLLCNELDQHARGELGWSAQLRKEKLRAGDRRRRTRAWREYACESFCDTAAWLYCAAARHAEFTLAQRFRSARRAWFGSFLDRQIVPF